MNRIEAMRDELARRFPGAEADLDAPADARGPWFLTVPRAGRSPIVVEWRPDRGFGISTPSAEDFGTGPDEVHANAAAATERVAALMESGGATGGSGPVRLGELRQLRGLSQAELAERAGVRQANVSRIERRGDVLLTTLGRIVGGMGGSLSVRATFPDGTEREIAVGPTGDPAEGFRPDPRGGRT